MTVVDSTRWKELSRQLDVALELTGDERAAWLAQLRGRDEPLADEIEALLAAQDEATAQGFLNGSAPWPLADASLAGRRVGAYTLDAPIGHGGMGSVWRAHRSDERFEATVAVKLLSLALVGEPGVRRFRREASIVAKLSHPNIARLLDAGVAQGQPYIVLEYVEGESIDRYCDARRLTVEGRLRLFLDVLAAVESAHASLVVHRDLKPSNLLVAREGRVKLLDFGIAKLLADQGQPTQEETRLLTPEYAAPEQFGGAAVTTATDVYALGLLLHVLLCGRHPGADKTVGERMRALLEGDVARLSEQPLDAGVALQRQTSVERLRRRLQGDLDNIVAKALQRDPRERYESVARLAEDIRRHLSDEPVSARADTLAYRAGKFVRKHRVGVATATLTVCALVAATVLTSWQMVEARAQRDEARYQTRRAQAVNDFMNVMMAQPGPATPLELLDKGRTLLEKQYGGDPAFMAGMLISIAGRYMDLGRIDKELETLEQAERIARARNDQELLASVQCNTVDTEVRLGRGERAEQRMQEARRALASLRKVRVGLRVSCLNAETFLARSQGDLDAAIAYAREALDVLERNGIRNLDYTTITSSLSALYGEKGMAKEAHAMNERTRESDELTGRAGSMGVLITAHNEAMDYFTFGDLRAAEARERGVIEQLNARGADGTFRPQFASLFGELLCMLGRTDEGLPWLRFSVWRAHAAGDTMVEARSKLRLGTALLRTGAVDEAVPLIDEASAVLNGDGSTPRERAGAARARIELLLAQNRIDDARHAVDALLVDAGYPHPGIPARIELPLLTAADVYLRAGDAAAAQSFAQAALAAARDVALDAQRSVDVGHAYLLVGKARLANGDVTGARDAFAHARLPIANGAGEDTPLGRELAGWLVKTSAAERVDAR